MIETNNNIGALYAYDMDGHGGATKLDPDALPGQAPGNGGFRWVHLDLEHIGAKEWIETHTDLVVAESLTLDETRPRCVRHDGGVLLNLRGVNLNPDSDPDDMVSIRLWVCGHLIISVRRRRLAAVVAMRESLDAGDAPKTVGAFLARLISDLTDRMAPVIDGLADQVDALEDASLDRVDGLRPDLAKLRRTTIALRRYVAPQRDALAHLIRDGANILQEEDAISIRETLDQVTRLVEEMDAIRERCGILNDQLADSRAEEMNRNMMVLSVVAAIFLPLGFLTGLLGVNVGGIPGAESPIAFAILCVLMLIIGGGITLLFKRLGWL